MEKRISKAQVNKGTLFKIKAFRDESKQKNLTIWLVAWTFCGLMIGSQVFLDKNLELRNMILIFLAFWAYFEYMVVKAFRWRKSGEEQLWIGEEEIQYGRTVNNRGILKPYRKDTANNVRLVEEEGNSFVKTFISSYWVVGEQRLAFTVSGKVIYFGMRLTDKEANQLMRWINEELNK